MSRNMIDTEIEYASVEDSLNIHRPASNDNSRFWDTKYNYESNVIISPGQGKIQILILNNKFCEVQTFPYLRPTGKFDYNSNAPEDISTSPAWQFNQRLLNFNQYFVSDADYVFFARSVYE